MVKATTDVQSAQQQVDAAGKAPRESRKNLLARRVPSRASKWTTSKLSTLRPRPNSIPLRSISACSPPPAARSRSPPPKRRSPSAQAQYQSAEAQVSGIPRFTELITGVVADRAVNAGDMASPGSPLFLIMDISRVVARINIPQNQADPVRVGQAAEIAVAGSDQQVMRAK